MASSGTPGRSGEGAFSSSFDANLNPFPGSLPRRGNSDFESPTSTISSPRMPLRTYPSSTAGTPQKKTVIKSDPTLVSCFDSADKELYDLWAPKQ